jgi:hypothetical protein
MKKLLLCQSTCVEEVKERTRDIEACCDGSIRNLESLSSTNAFWGDEEEIIILRGLLLVTAKMDDDKEKRFQGKIKLYTEKIIFYISTTGMACDLKLTFIYFLLFIGVFKVIFLSKKLNFDIFKILSNSLAFLKMNQKLKSIYCKFL